MCYGAPWEGHVEERSCGITGCGRWPKRLGRGRENVDAVEKVRGN